MKIAVVGSYGTGMTMRLPHMPARGETIAGATFAAGPGGKGSNQAIGAARLGAEVCLLTAVGNDSFGSDARALWEREGVDASAVITTRRATMVGVILVESDGENRIVIAPGALDDLTATHIEAFSETIAHADLLMVCNEIPVDAVTAALTGAHRHGVATLYNPAPARDLPEHVRGYVDYLTPNFGEARVLAGVSENADGQSWRYDDPPADTPEAILDALRSRYRATIALTAGADGAYVDDGAHRTHVPAVEPAAIIDTTGAGDTFNAAFAVALCRGETPEAATQYACAAGAFAVSREEVIPGLPTPAEIDALLPSQQLKGLS